ncbi:MAG TPA: protein kinase, partial [Kofleriaceae bacterium]|nr:protein kinase [Kofleriaceae bacterium]
MSSGELDQTADAGSGPAAELVAGTQLGKYRLERQLGAGGMGIVWAAHDPDLERAVAIKVLHRADADPTQRARLLREARAMARLKHPNVLTVYEVNSAGERDYIVMELVEGTNLDAWLKAGPPRAEVYQAILAAGRGLSAAHAAGIVHRDFKPHNVLRSRDGRVLVTDFGLARSAVEPSAGFVPAAAPAASRVSATALADTLQPTPRTPSSGLLESTLTQTGAMIGTPAYMAPEQYLGAPPDPRTDQFAFCVTAWQALTGERPFRGQTLEELQRAAAAGVAGVRARLPRRVRAALARGLAADPDARWPDLDALLAALDRAFAAPPLHWRRIIPPFAIVAAAVLLWTMRRDHAVENHDQPAPCSAEADFQDAWTPLRRANLDQRVGVAATSAGDALDATRATWLDAYGPACTAKRTPLAIAQLGCLLGVRDEVAAAALVVETLPVAAFERLDLRGTLPRVDACKSDVPIAPPALPEDPKQRTKIVSLRAEVWSLQLREPQTLLADEARFRRNAQALGWPPLEALLDHALGSAALLVGRYAEARKYFTSSAERAAQLHDYRLEAWARVSRLETESVEAEDPTDAAREKQLEREARDAVQRAGDDPDLADSIDAIVGGAMLSRGDIAGVEALLAKQWWADAKHKSQLVALKIRLRLADGQVDEAARLGADYEKLPGPTRRELERLLAEVAWRRGDLDDAHARADKQQHMRPFDTTRLIRGHVVDSHGAPVAHARVVAWQGELAGDARRIYTSPDLAGAVDTTTDRGEFSLAISDDGAIMAERDDLRSTPISTAKLAESPTLVVAPVHAITLHASGPTRGIPLDAFV